MTCCVCCEPCAWVCRIAIFVVIAGGIVLSIFTILTCEFVFYKDEDTSVSTGIYAFLDPTKSACAVYPSDIQFDSLMQTARAGAGIALLLAAGEFLLLLFETICCKIPCSSFISSLALFLAAASQSLTFVIFGSNEFCGGLVAYASAAGENLSKDVAGNLMDALKGNLPNSTSTKLDWDQLTAGLADYPCQMGRSGYYSALACACFLGASFIACFSFRPEPCMKK